jgi:hypothetical protein
MSTAIWKVKSMLITLVKHNWAHLKIKTVIADAEKYSVALGGLVVSVLATGPKVRGFKPRLGRWILRVIKSVARLPSEGK